MARPDVEQRPTPGEFGDYLRAMIDPGTPEEWRQFHESQARIRQTEAELRRGLPPREGIFVSLDSSEEVEVPDQATLQTERLLDDVFAPDLVDVEESVARLKPRIFAAIAEIRRATEISIVPEIEGDPSALDEKIA